MKCCHKNKNKKRSGLTRGVLSGVLPHIGCIGFIVFSVLGVGAATAVFRPLLLSPYFFYILLGISFLFATVSAFIYLKREESLSLEGFIENRGYLTVLYSSTVVINLLLFMVIFPLAANIGREVPHEDVLAQASLVDIDVDIPCPGHAPLIIDEMKVVEGVKDVEYSFPSSFSVAYDNRETSPEEITSSEVFDTYKPEIIEKRGPSFVEETEAAEGEFSEKKCIDNSGCICRR